MDTPIRVAVREARYYERTAVLRLPFRFGIVTITELRQANLRLRVEDQAAHSAWGIAAESLVPKCFDKQPQKSEAENVAELRRAIAVYSISTSPAAWRPLSICLRRPNETHRVLREEGISPLAAGFGPALLDHAVIDAAARLNGVGFSGAIRGNLAGIKPIQLTPDLASIEVDRFLGGLTPRETVAVRHTVGLLDPLTRADVADGGQLHDGLPQTLEDIIDATGVRWFKLKVAGQCEDDLDRLRRAASVLDRKAADYRVTLDGNEQYSHPEEFEAFWQAMLRRPELARLMRAIVLVEQPVARARVSLGVRAPASIAL